MKTLTSSEIVCTVGRKLWLYGLFGSTLPVLHCFNPWGSLETYAPAAPRACAALTRAESQVLTHFYITSTLHCLSRLETGIYAHFLSSWCNYILARYIEKTYFSVLKGLNPNLTSRLKHKYSLSRGERVIKSSSFFKKSRDWPSWKLYWWCTCKFHPPMSEIDERKPNRRAETASQTGKAHEEYSYPIYT